VAAERTLIVLGAGVWEGGIASPTLRRRTQWACRLFNEGGYDLLVLSGAEGKHPPAEACVMKSIALERGVPLPNLVLDTGAFTTLDTASFAARMPEAARRRFVAVTDLYHALRTRLAFRAFGLDVEVSTPPLGRRTRRVRLAWSFFRELPALVLYGVYFVRIRLTARTRAASRS
jgi:vancomycin permeability regulator SanA